MRDIRELQYLQALPLSIKVRMTKQRLREFVDFAGGPDGGYISFSGGKDSTVLLTIAREMYPGIKACFSDTGLEFPEIREFVRTWDNVDWIRPRMTFKQVIEKYGYPMISKEVSEVVSGARRFFYDYLEKTNGKLRYPYDFARLMGVGKWSDEEKRLKLEDALRGALEEAEQRQIGGGGAVQRFELLSGIYTKDKRIDKKLYDSIEKNVDRSVFSCVRYKYFLFAPFEIGNQCCNVMKKGPMKKYAKETGRYNITAMMASESRLRTTKWMMQGGCNAYEAKSPSSMPMSFWTEQDVLQYIYENRIPIAKVYGDVIIDYKGMEQLEGQLSFGELGIFDTGSPLYKTTGYDRTGCMFCGYGCHLEKPGEGRFERMKVTHPKQYDYIMRPKDQGGLGYKEVIDWINENGGFNIKY